MASLSMSSQAAPQVSQLFQFTYPTSVNNLFTLPNGCLLLSTSANTDLWYIDPKALYPSAQRVVTLPGSTGIALHSFAALGDGLYAVSGGPPPQSNSKAPMQVYVVMVETEGDVNVTVEDTVGVPALSMDGTAALPKYPSTILSADGIGGRILRINTSDHTLSVAFEHTAFQPGDGGDMLAPGVKGLKIRDNYLYFTNLAQRIFGRFPINEVGTNTGDVEILARLNYTSDGAAYGDFSFDSEGNAYVAAHPSSVYKITPEGAQSVFAGGVNSTFLGPTSVVVSNDGKSIYVSTAGKDSGFPITGGQVLKVQVEGNCTEYRPPLQKRR